MKAVVDEGAAANVKPRNSRRPASEPRAEAAFATKTLQAPSKVTESTCTTAFQQLNHASTGEEPRERHGAPHRHHGSSVAKTRPPAVGELRQA